MAFTQVGFQSSRGAPYQFMVTVPAEDAIIAAALRYASSILTAEEASVATAVVAGDRNESVRRLIEAANEKEKHTSGGSGELTAKPVDAGAKGMDRWTSKSRLEHKARDYIVQAARGPATKANVGYDNARWDSLVNSVIEHVRRLSSTKGAEYSGDVDRLANFRRGAAKAGVPPELILAIYAGKHMDAIDTYVRDLVEQRIRLRSEPIEGRVLDLIVYMILLLAMVEERTGRQV